MNAHAKTWAVVAVVGALGLAVACSSPQVSRPPAGKGQLAVDLVDAPNPDVQQIWITVTSVRAHAAGAGWVTISDPTLMPLKLDLLKLQSASAPLGLATLPPGTVTQLRLLVAATGNTVVVGGVEHPLDVPSGFESGIKIHGPWQITACGRASVTLDFDGRKSVQTHPTGSGDGWILRPVVRVRASGQTEVGCGGGADGGTDDGGEVPLVPAGGACTQGVDCLSGTCAANVCAGGPAGAPCQAPADCLSGSCSESETCAAPPAAVGAGGACTTGAGCLSTVCTAGVCMPGDQGAVCKVPADCLSASCFEGSCVPASAL